MGSRQITVAPGIAVEQPYRRGSLAWRQCAQAGAHSGRVADPKDIAGAAVFFASPAASFITGQVLDIDGGISASQ